MESKIIEAEFIVLEDRGTESLLECPRCGIEFDVDLKKDKNLIWDWAKMASVAMCPLCGTQQI